MQGNNDVWIEKVLWAGGRYLSKNDRPVFFSGEGDREPTHPQPAASSSR
jgi:hypothetical protein